MPSPCLPAGASCLVRRFVDQARTAVRSADAAGTAAAHPRDQSTFFFDQEPRSCAEESLVFCIFGTTSSKLSWVHRVVRYDPARVPLLQ